MIVNATYAARGIRLVLVPNDTKEVAVTTVTGIPANSVAQTGLHLSRVVFWPVPRTIAYEDLMSLKPGQIVMGA